MSFNADFKMTPDDCKSVLRTAFAYALIFVLATVLLTPIVKGMGKAVCKEMFRPSIARQC